jgi:hypothetical protein
MFIGIIGPLRRLSRHRLHSAELGEGERRLTDLRVGRASPRETDTSAFMLDRALNLIAD